MRRSTIFLLAALALPSAAIGQSNPGTGLSSGVVHGQRPDMRQDLHNDPSAPAAAAAPGSPVGPQGPTTRTERLRAQSRAATTRTPAQQRQFEERQRQRAAQQREQAARGQQARAAQTATGPAGGRSADPMAAQEARMADARRRQMEQERAAADRQDGVVLGSQPLGSGSPR
jgi:hypothetical protein